MSDDFERTLCQLPQCHVFRIPARKSADGHRAADWPKDPIWTGKLKITAKGRLAIISLIDDKNAVFASCPVTDDAAVERTLDSGRYFVLRIQNAQGKHAFIGIAFNERNDSFDFNVALQEHKSECEREDLAAAQAASGVTAVQAPSRDFSLKEGQKIHVSLGSGGTKKEKPVSSGGAIPRLAPPGSKPGLLAPPPADSAPAVHSAAPATVFGGATAAASSSAPADPWGSLTSSFSQVSVSPPSKPSSSGFDDFSFGSSDPFASTPTSATAFSSDPFGFPSPAPAPAATKTTAPAGSKPVQSVNLLDL